MTKRTIGSERVLFIFCEFILIVILKITWDYFHPHAVSYLGNVANPNLPNVVAGIKLVTTIIFWTVFIWIWLKISANLFLDAMLERGWFSR